MEHSGRAAGQTIPEQQLDVSAEATDTVVSYKWMLGMAG